MATQVVSTTDLVGQVGTLQYRSPEMRSQKEYSFNTDCWSLGCVLYELITLKQFYREERLEMDEAIQKEISDLNALKFFKKLLNMMLQVNRENRTESEGLKAFSDSKVFFDDDYNEDNNISSMPPISRISLQGYTCFNYSLKSVFKILKFIKFYLFKIFQLNNIVIR